MAPNTGKITTVTSTGTSQSMEAGRCGSDGVLWRLSTKEQKWGSR
jgi:hypothetical protein